VPFSDRRDAGRRLAASFADRTLDDAVVVALPRGGVPVAYEVARTLGAPLDVLVVRKLGCPWQPELGLGALGEGGVRILNQRLIATVGVTPAQLEDVVERETAELERRIERYRGDREAIPVRGRTVVLVDDGLATGSTARAGIAVLREHGAATVILAIPVAPRGTVDELAEVADEVVCLETPASFWAIGEHYADFSQTGDGEVADLLAAATA
jgi:putative phosphoribosyl transferase